jgi:hypothetical protein
MPRGFRVRRLAGNPIITPALDPSIGDNINGPSLIRAPEALPGRLGRYYLYFAHHRGRFIRLAFADDLAGPWRLYRPGTLRLEQTPCVDHIASPDVHIDGSSGRVVMYFHGPARVPAMGQWTFRAVSDDGLNFRVEPRPLGVSYFRVFEHEGALYAVAKSPNVDEGALLYRAGDRVGFEPVGSLLPRMRHAAVWKRGDRLTVFFSRGRDCPERILAVDLTLRGGRLSRPPGPEVEVIAPEADWEGVGLPAEPSRFGAAGGPVRQLRDPAVFQDDGRTYLLYSVAGESGIAVAEIADEPADVGRGAAQSSP